MLDTDCDTYVSDDQIALWKELSCLHFTNREIDKFCKRERKSAPGIIYLEDGSRVMQQELHKRLRSLCVSMFADIPSFGDCKQGYVFVLCETDLAQKVRGLLRATDFDPLPFLVQAMDRVIQDLEVSSETLAHPENLDALRLLRGGFAKLAKSR